MTDGGATVSMLGRASVQRPCFIVQIDKKGQGFRSFSGKKREKLHRVSGKVNVTFSRK